MVAVKRFPLSKRLASDSINASSSLLDFRRIPIKVIVDHMPAMTMQIDTFLPYLCTDKDFRKQWRIESIEDSCPCIYVITTACAGHKSDKTLI